MDYQVDQGYPDHQDQLENLVKMESRVKLEPLERKVSKDQKEPWDHKDHQVNILIHYVKHIN
jgi:hypothetical protein